MLIAGGGGGGLICYFGRVGGRLLERGRLIEDIIL